MHKVFVQKLREPLSAESKDITNKTGMILGDNMIMSLKGIQLESVGYKNLV
jgi:hypothetical protein